MSTQKKVSFCPYCDEEMSSDVSYCRSCQITVFYCPKCRKPVERDKRVCPHCGAAIRNEERVRGRTGRKS